MADILFRALEKWWRCTIRMETRLPLFGMTMSPECKKIILNNNDNDKDNNNNNNNNYKWLSEIKGGDCFVSTDPNTGRTGTSWMTDWSSHSLYRVDLNVPFVRWPWNDSGNRWAVWRIRKSLWNAVKHRRSFVFSLLRFLLSFLFLNEYVCDGLNFERMILTSR